MATPSNLDIAFKEQIKNVDGVTAEMLKDSIKSWKWNRDRIHEIETFLRLGTNKDGDALGAPERKSLIDEKHKYMSENSQLQSHITKALKGTVTEVDEFDAFLRG